MSEHHARCPNCGWTFTVHDVPQNNPSVYPDDVQWFCPHCGENAKTDSVAYDPGAPDLPRIPYRRAKRQNRCPLCSTFLDENGYCVDPGCPNVGKTP